MKTNDLPFNVDLLDNGKGALSKLRPVTVLDIYDGAPPNFHDDGLFSTLTFGPVGDESRDNKFSYIDMGVTVIHPTIYKELIKLKALYKGIMAGTKYAKWDDKLKDFVTSTELEGSTGYSFFISKWLDIVFVENSSDARQLRVDLVNKYRGVGKKASTLPSGGDKTLIRYMVVLPAGLRDLTVQDGRTTEDEINALYRKVLSISKTVDITDGNINNPIHDVSRWTLQNTFLEIYQTIHLMLTGKKGFIQAKWGRRRIFNGTRNVISSMDMGAADSSGETMIEVTDTVLGLLQVMKGALPLTVHAVRNSIIQRIFSDGDAAVPLIDTTTLATELVDLDSKERDKWLTIEGIEKIIDNYRDNTKRHDPIMIRDRYLALIYDDGETFKVFNDITLLPEDRDRKYVRPITWCEFFYTSCYAIFKEKLSCIITRYPITGIGSTYPSTIYLKTTVVGKLLRPLNSAWETDDSLPNAIEFPSTVEKGAHLDSTVVHPGRLAALGADFDGDTVSVNIIYSDEGNAEIHKYFETKEAYLDPRGGLQQSTTDPIQWAIFNMTK